MKFGKMLIYSAKAETITGAVTAISVTGFSFTTDVMPVISEIGVIAGTLVALHGLFRIILRYYYKWQGRSKNDDWFY